MLAPGTEKDSIVRLKNNAKREVRYTAILYSLSTDAELSIGASLSGNGFSDITDYILPEEINRDTVLRAVSGMLAANAMQDFDINWYWAFEQDIDTDASDRIDTYLGDKAADAVVLAARDGQFLSKDDFRQRTKVSKSVIDFMDDLHIFGDIPESNQISLFDFQ